MTIELARLLREIQERFAAAPLQYGHGTDNAWDEAVALVLGVSGLPDSKSSMNTPIADSVVATIRELARRRIAERQPLAYLLGNAPYCGELFYVPPGVMVPRSPIGPLLRDGGLRPWLRAPRHILDLCCGTGCLGLVAAKIFPDAQVVLVDIDPLAVETTRRNIAEHRLAGRVVAVCSDLFAGLERGVDRANNTSTNSGEEIDSPVLGNPRFDLILCNPPYVDTDTMATLPPEFAQEPALGLAGGTDGLDLMNRVIGGCNPFLTEDGVLVGEVGDGATRLQASWPSLPFIWPDLPEGGEGVFVLLAADVRRHMQTD